MSRSVVQPQEVRQNQNGWSSLVKTYPVTHIGTKSDYNNECGHIHRSKWYITSCLETSGIRFTLILLFIYSYIVLYNHKNQYHDPNNRDVSNKNGANTEKDTASILMIVNGHFGEFWDNVWMFCVMVWTWTSGYASSRMGDTNETLDLPNCRVKYSHTSSNSMGRSRMFLFSNFNMWPLIADFPIKNGDFQ